VWIDDFIGFLQSCLLCVFGVKAKGDVAGLRIAVNDLVERNGPSERIAACYVLGLQVPNSSGVTRA